MSVITAQELRIRRALHAAAPMARVRLDDRQLAILARAAARAAAQGRPEDGRLRPSPVAPVLGDADVALLKLLALGLENVQIGRRLGLVPARVQSRVRGLYRVLGVSSRAHAVGVGYELGLLGGDPDGPTVGPGAASGGLGRVGGTGGPSGSCGAVRGDSVASGLGVAS